MNYIDLKYLAVVTVLLTTIGCERELSEDAVPSTFAKTAEIFTDNFIGMGTDFYLPFSGAKADVFSVDQTMGFESDASIRIDVPNADDPEGGFAGAIFRVDGTGRNLTDFDALTFYARASQAVTIGEMGFGVNFEGDTYRAIRSGIDLTTGWTKYVIPIPDPSVLTEERGLLIFSAGGIGDVPGQEVGYTFWLDEIKFEKLGNLAQAQPAINNGAESVQAGFVGGTVNITGFTQTLNVDGSNVTVGTTPAYFDFQSSDESVAAVDESGIITIVGSGTAEITATLAGVKAAGKVIVNSLGDFDTAPVPTRDADDVISIFSDVYPNEPASVISNFGGQTSTLSAFSAGGDNILNYQNVNFFGIEFNSNVEVPLIDGSAMTTLHLDIYIPGAVGGGALLNVALRDAGPNGMVETDIFTGLPIGDDSQVGADVPLVSSEWISMDLDITGLNQQAALAQIVFFSPDSGPNEFYVDNIYFY